MAEKLRYETVTIWQHRHSNRGYKTIRAGSRRKKWFGMEQGRTHGVIIPINPFRRNSDDSCVDINITMDWKFDARPKRYTNTDTLLRLDERYGLQQWQYLNGTHIVSQFSSKSGKITMLQKLDRDIEDFAEQIIRMRGVDFWYGDIERREKMKPTLEMRKQRGLKHKNSHVLKFVVSSFQTSLSKTQRRLLYRAIHVASRQYLLNI